MAVHVERSDGVGAHNGGRQRVIGAQEPGVVLLQQPPGGENASHLGWDIGEAGTRKRQRLQQTVALSTTQAVFRSSSLVSSRQQPAGMGDATLAAASHVREWASIMTVVSTSLLTYCLHRSTTGTPSRDAAPASWPAVWPRQLLTLAGSSSRDLTPCRAPDACPQTTDTNRQDPYKQDPCSALCIAQLQPLAQVADLWACR